MICIQVVTRLTPRYIIGLIIATTACCIHFAFKQPFANVRTVAIDYTEAFAKTTVELEAIADAFKFDKAGLDTLRAAICKTRLAFKKAECLLAYYYPEYVEEHINGAPVLRIERNDSRAVVKEPEGLQVLDELIAGDAGDDKVKIAALARQLKTHSALLLVACKQQRVKEHEWIDAIRLQLIRIFSKGITGFDTPGSLNALPEACSSLMAIRALTVPLLKEKNVLDQNTKLVQFLDDAIAYLQQPVTFNDFDRLVFLKQYINPLYNEFLQPGLHVNAPAANEAWNRTSRNLFSNNFLDPYYYTELKEQEDNDALRLLGKKLFYDPVLSSNNQISCATCHNPSLAFSDGRPKSASNVKGHTVQRNAPSLLNAVYSRRYFYDMRAFTLEQQAEHVIFNQMEFNTAYPAILQKLNNNDLYKGLFKTCFGKETITRDQFSKALASYVLSLRSFNSLFDKYVRDEIKTIDADVQQGFNLFMGKAQCGTCHFAPNFSGLVPPLYTENESEVLGIPEDPDAVIKKADTDNGRFNNKLYSEMAWIYEKSFKTVTVRNAALTAPYFHNGSYKTLEQVVDFYNNGGGVGMGLNIKNQTLAADSLHLSDGEKRSLVAFMQSLNGQDL
ncbi:MAG TPA: cytochrome c peroxidase [Niastella sp.]